MHGQACKVMYMPWLRQCCSHHLCTRIALQAYTETAKKLLEQSRSGFNPYEGYSVREPKDSVRMETKDDFDR